MPTLKTKQAFKIMVEKMVKKDPITMGEVLREAGYSDSISKKPKMVTESKGWKELLAKIDNQPLLDRLNELALSEDKRISHEAIKTILIDLKGLGAEKSAKVIGLFEKVGELQIEDNKEDNIDDKPDITTEENQLPAPSGTTGSPELQE